MWWCQKYSRHIQARLSSPKFSRTTRSKAMIPRAVGKHKHRTHSEKSPILSSALPSPPLTPLHWSSFHLSSEDLTLFTFKSNTVILLISSEIHPRLGGRQKKKKKKKDGMFGHFFFSRPQQLFFHLTIDETLQCRRRK